MRIEGAKNIYIDNNVYVGYKTSLAAVAHDKIIIPLLKIGRGTSLGNFNHIYCTQSITIGNHVLTAGSVYISDNLHSYEDVNIPIIKQPIKQINPVIIGDGTWLGENVCVIGSTIGKNCVIGANSVVTKDIPDCCVAVGAPAKIIKKYNIQTDTWEEV
ncbi:hypothetical protein FACS189413_18070 [Bacteroidia bacterium]|nr:hypothetical protein FACS189413_18070 [Bacteroidia bacterium]